MANFSSILWLRGSQIFPTYDESNFLLRNCTLIISCHSLQEDPISVKLIHHFIFRHLSDKYGTDIFLLSPLLSLVQCLLVGWRTQQWRFRVKRQKQRQCVNHCGMVEPYKQARISINTFNNKTSVDKIHDGSPFNDVDNYNSIFCTEIVVSSAIKMNDSLSSFQYFCEWLSIYRPIKFVILFCYHIKSAVENSMFFHCFSCSCNLYIFIEKISKFSSTHWAIFRIYWVIFQSQPT